MEAALAVGGDNELVTTDAPPLAVEPHISGIADAVATVVHISGIAKQLLDIDASEIVVIRQFICAIIHKVSVGCVYYQ